ncbi:MAG: hypothetical protein AAF934_11400 [Bacteroidota bacterium]
MKQLKNKAVVILNGAKRNEESSGIEILRCAQNDSTSLHIPIAIGTGKSFLTKTYY